MNKAQKILETAAKYNNSDDMLQSVYGIDSNTHYDAYVIAPGWTPEKILRRHQQAEIRTVSKGTYIASYEVEFDGKKLAWFQCASGAGNLIDSMLCLAKNKVEPIIFIGAVGALKEDILIGELATPLESYAYEDGISYLGASLKNDRFGTKVVPDNMKYVDNVLTKAKEQGITLAKRKVFCTTSIMCEYSMLDEIKETGAELIEMETASFYECLRMMEKKGIALLAVSDNSASGVSLVARDEESSKRFYNAREVEIPELIKIACDVK